MLFFLVQYHHMNFVDIEVLSPEHGRSVTDFWDLDAHEAQLRCPGGVWVVLSTFLELVLFVRSLYVNAFGNSLQIWLKL